MDTDALKRTFGRRVQALRERAGLTQENLADRIGRSVDTVSNIERGANSTRVETAARIAEALGVELRELFEPEDGPLAGRPRRREIAVLTARLAALDDASFASIKQLLTIAIGLALPLPDRS
jgi:transcriptional regulator with XRE-family HTH domain